MFKPALAALTCAAAIAGASCASAATVYTETGVAMGAGPANNFPVGYIDLWTTTGPNPPGIFSEGRYSYSLTVDAGALTNIEFFSSAFRWGEVTSPDLEFIEEPLVSDATFQATPTGFAGAFSVGPPHVDATSHSADYTSIGFQLYLKPGEVAPYTFTVTALPEPATWTIMLLGFGGIGAVVRSQRRRLAASPI